MKLAHSEYDVTAKDDALEVRPGLVKRWGVGLKQMQQQQRLLAARGPAPRSCRQEAVFGTRRGRVPAWSSEPCQPRPDVAWPLVSNAAAYARAGVLPAAACAAQRRDRASRPGMRLLFHPSATARSRAAANPCTAALPSFSPRRWSCRPPTASPTAGPRLAPSWSRTTTATPCDEGHPARINDTRSGCRLQAADTSLRPSRPCNPATYLAPRPPRPSALV